MVDHNMAANTKSPEDKLVLEIPRLIPGPNSAQSCCLERLEKAMQSQAGVQRAHVKHESAPPLLCLHYSPALLSAQEAQRAAEQAGAQIARRYRHEALAIEGMDCSDCALILEHGLERSPGVMDARVSFNAQTLQIEYDAQRTNLPAVRKRVKQLGFLVPARGAYKWILDNHELMLSLICGAVLLAGWLGEAQGAPQALSLGLYLTAYLAGGWHTARHAWNALRQRRFDTDLLMLAAAVGAASLGQLAEGGLLLFLFSLGHALEERLMARTRSSIRSLSDLAPRQALVRRDGVELSLPVEQVAIGDTVFVLPGVRLPVDGSVISGSSAVDQSPLTGESVPVERREGDPVYAGSVNGEGALEVRATRLAKDSTLQRVIRMVEAAQAEKSPAQLGAERFMRWFVPGVLVADLLLIVVPPLFGVPFSTAFLRAMTLLVAASPCALALGTPAAVLAGISQAARSGILVKGGAHLETLGRLRAVAFDKTGTLTTGKLEVTDLISYLQPSRPGEDGKTDDLLALAASVERRSSHPLAQAVVRAADQRGLALSEAVNVKAASGLGVQAEVGDSRVWVGSRKWLEQNALALAEPAAVEISRLEGEGKTVITVWQDGSLAGLIAVADVVRAEAEACIADLRRMGVRKVVMLTGDHAEVASHIAAQAGLTDVLSGLMPAEKLAAVRELVQQEGTTAMVGDGVNDAPALAQASLGIAMGGSGTDVALETADVVLMSADLAKLPYAVGLGRASLGVIRQNLVIAVGTILVLVLAAVTGQAGIGITVLFHEGSTLLVVLNALRLLNFRGAKAV